MSAGSIGLVALWGSVAVSAAAVSTGWWPGSRDRAARSLLGLAGLLAGVSTLCLAFALVVNDFSLDYVARTTSLATPWPYRLAALWGAMEGSLLFYSALTISVGWYAVRTAAPALSATATRVISAIGCGFLLLTALVASPFTSLDVPPVDGQGLLAILQHPAMVYHPPILYLGLTTLVAPFALTVAAIVARSLDRVWLDQSRRWLLVSWTLLTVGMAAGANWAYVELGWGGFWAWDPVENTALMPWLAATVFLHVSRIHRRDGRLARWSVASALLPFVLTLLGVYLTRSGSTGSIHAFAESPVIGRILLIIAGSGLVFTCVLVLRSSRGSPWERLTLFGRDTWLASSGGLVTIALLFVTVGSAYPAYLAVFRQEQVLVTPRFFINLLYPISVVVCVGLAFAFRTRWAPTPMSPVRLGLFTVVAVGAALLASGVLGTSPLAAVLLLGLAAGALATLGKDLAWERPSGRILAGHLAHIGMAVVIVGAAGSALGHDFTGPMSPGERVEVGRYTVVLDDIQTGEADRFLFVTAELTLSSDGGSEFGLTPQIRAYEEQAAPVPEPALHSRPGEDVVVAISRVASDASVVEVTVLVRPLVFWVWVGASLVALGGLVSLVSTDADAGGRRRSAIEAPQPAETPTSG